MVNKQLRNIKGGGLHYVADWKTPDMRLFQAGLKHDPTNLYYLTKDRVICPGDTHDKLSYQRGLVKHSRSSTNQYFNFHFWYGGFHKFVIQRYFYQSFYQRCIKVFAFPTLVVYAIGCYGMRKYDTAAYNFFYFSD